MGEGYRATHMGDLRARVRRSARRAAGERLEGYGVTDPRADPEWRALRARLGGLDRALREVQSQRDDARGRVRELELERAALRRREGATYSPEIAALRADLMHAADCAVPDCARCAMATRRLEDTRPRYVDEAELAEALERWRALEVASMALVDAYRDRSALAMRRRYVAARAVAAALASQLKRQREDPRRGALMPRRASLTEQMAKFAAAYVQNGGNLLQAARAAGYAGDDKNCQKHGKRLAEKPHVRAEIERLTTGVGIATKDDRQRWWTAIMNGVPMPQLVDGEVIRAPFAAKDRLRASELLGKSQLDFLDGRKENKEDDEDRVVVYLPDNGRGDRA
jgi:hypothetical protein